MSDFKGMSHERIEGIYYRLKDKTVTSNLLTLKKLKEVKEKLQQLKIMSQKGQKLLKRKNLNLRNFHKIYKVL